MTHIVGIVGSLRRGSYNLSLLRAAESLMPAGATLDVRTIAGIPLYIMPTMRPPPACRLRSPP